MRFKGIKAIKGDFHNTQECQRATMPKERKDTKPTAQEEEAEVSPDGLEGDGKISAAADHLAAVTLADNDEAGSGTGTSESQQDGAVECYDPLSDPDLWKPHPPTEDCPVCLVPLPIEGNKTTYWPCCGKTICVACLRENDRALFLTNAKREMEDLPPLEKSCAFCRETIYKNDAEYAGQIKKRIGKGDAEAMFIMAHWCLDGEDGIPKDEAKAVELFKKAAEMGSVRAMYHLADSYFTGTNGFPKDKKKSIEYFENTVKMGDVDSRCILGAVSVDEENFQLATKHYRLAAEAGHESAVREIWKLFSNGELGKTDLEEILRAHQSACDEMDSEDRRRYDAFNEAMEGNDENLKDIYIAYYYEGVINAKQLKEALAMHRKGCRVAEIRKFIANANTANESS